MLGPPTGSMMASTPRPRVIAPTRSSTFSLFAVDDVIGAKLAGKARLGFAGDDADDDQAGNLGQVDQRIAHAAGSRIDQHGLALAQRQRIVEDVIGDLIIGERRCGIELDVVGQQKSRFRRRRDIVGIMPAAMRPLARGGVDALARRGAT